MIYANEIKNLGSDEGTSIVWGFLELDTTADFDDIGTEFPDTMFVMSSKAHVIEDNQIYMLKSDGTWVVQDEASRMNVYTKPEVDQLIEDVVDNQADVDYDQNKEIQLNRELIVQNLNMSYKNRARIFPNSDTFYGTTFTVDKDAGTITTSGTASGYKAFRFFGDMDNIGYSYAIPIPRGTYYIKGLPSGASASTFRYILGLYTDSSATRQTTYIYDNDYVLTVDNDTTRIDLSAYISQGNVFVNPVVWKPFLIEQNDYYADPTFVPYCPTPREMWTIIRNLHSL